MPETIAISVLVDTIIFATLFILALGRHITLAIADVQEVQLPSREMQMYIDTTAGSVRPSELSSYHRVKRLYISKLTHERLGNATIGLGWILVFLVSLSSRLVAENSFSRSWSFRSSTPPDITRAQSRLGLLPFTSWWLTAPHE